MNNAGIRKQRKKGHPRRVEEGWRRYLRIESPPYKDLRFGVAYLTRLQRKQLDDSKPSWEPLFKGKQWLATGNGIGQLGFFLPMTEIYIWWLLNTLGTNRAVGCQNLKERHWLGLVRSNFFYFGWSTGLAGHPFNSVDWTRLSNCRSNFSPRVASRVYALFPFRFSLFYFFDLKKV